MKTTVALRLLPLVIALLSFTWAHAAEKKRSKNINFEDELVEGINRKALDQFQQISELSDADHPHLYKKRASFSDRNRILFREWKQGSKP